jgi:hypothetical protein
MVGLREWASSSKVSDTGKAKKEKLEACDLLEVYMDQDRVRLRDKEPTIKWNSFIMTEIVDEREQEGEVQFTSNDNSDEYDKIMAGTNGNSQIIGVDTDTDAKAKVDDFFIDDI